MAIHSVNQLEQRIAQLKGSSGPKIRVLVSLGTCGIAAGTRPVFDALAAQITAQNKSAEMTLVETGCMGLCHSEPSIEVLDMRTGKSVIYGNVTPQQAEAIIKAGSAGTTDVEQITRSWYYPETEQKSSQTLQARIVLRNCGRIDPEKLDEYLVTDGYMALAKVLGTMQPQQVVESMIESGLRGRGGGGFPTGKKWQFAAAQKTDVKYIICNADEGDPGAFMDRAVLEGDPHSVLEAMAIAGYAIGANEGIIYIRAEYPLAIKRLEIAIDQAKAEGLIGQNLFGTGFSFDISIKYGAGAFVCGEETALISSIEGMRGQPVFKPPFPAVEGLWRKPTIVNNVETFANIAAIFRKGAPWFKSIGTQGSPGTKVFALAGKINKVGLIEVPMGTKLKEIIYGLGQGIANGKAFKAVQTGGPSGGCITAASLETPIDYETLKQLGSMMGSGGMIVMDEDDCMVDVARFFLEFTMDESCGKCTPCRVGGRQMFGLLEKITKGKATEDDLVTLRKLGEAVKFSSLCGLGMTAPNPVLATMRCFEEEYRAHVVDHRCPAGKCAQLLTYTIVADKCTGCSACTKKCPTSCISGKRKQVHFIEQDACIKCGSCYDTCRFDAITKK